MNTDTNHNDSSSERTNAPVVMHLASGWERFFAYVIDGILLGIVLSLLDGVATTRINAATSFDDAYNILLVYLVIVIVIQTTYLIVCGVYGGQTFGKMFVGIRVVRLDTKPLMWRDALLRAFGYLLNGFTFGIGFGWLLIDEKRQGWHDKIAKTIVVNIRQRR